MRLQEDSRFPHLLAASALPYLEKRDGPAVGLTWELIVLSCVHSPQLQDDMKENTMRSGLGGALL